MKKSRINQHRDCSTCGVSQPAVSRLERNVSSASLTTLQRYAAACGMHIKLSLQ
ncbi:helix-turn-helix domain-containing protein [Escherichia coli]